MFLDELRDYCLTLPEATEDQPFGPDVLVFRIGGKMFALVDMDGISVNLKCLPERAIQLREEFPEDITPGYHMNKKHWNTVRLRGGRLGRALIEDLILHSHALVTATLQPRSRPAAKKTSMDSVELESLANPGAPRRRKSPK